MKLFKEFKDFAVKGNMMDMAVGIIIGAAFNKVIDVLVKKVLLPPLSLLSGNTNMADKRIVLKDAIVGDDGVVTKAEVAIGYGYYRKCIHSIRGFHTTHISYNNRIPVFCNICNLIDVSVLVG